MTERANRLVDLARTMTAVQLLVDRVRPEQWADPTPCTEWNVRQLVNHLANGNCDLP